MAADAPSPAWKVFAGKWKLDRSENFEEYLNEIGANIWIRKIAPRAAAELDITIDGNRVIILFSTNFMKTEPNLFLVNSGNETDAVFNGKRVKAKTTWQDGKLVIIIAASADGAMKARKISREIVGQELVQPWKIFAGKWKLERSENFDEYLKEMGVNAVMRKIAGNINMGTFDITVDGDKVTIAFSAPFVKSQANTFYVNSGTQTDASFNGKTVKAKATWQNGKLVLEFSGTEDGEFKAQKVTRELIGENELVQTMEVGTVFCRRYMNRIP